MIKALSRITLCAAISLSGAFAKTGPRLPAHPTKIAYDSLKWQVPLGEPHRTVLPGGLRTYVAVDSQLPLVQITGYVRHGSLADPVGKEGLSTLLASLLRSGGTRNRSADSLDALLDLLAMRFSFSAQEAQLTFSASFLADYTDTALGILKEMLFAPAFDSTKLERERKIMLEAIAHRFDNPGPTLGAAYQKSMYSEQVPGRMVSAESVRRISRKDLMDLHQQVFKTPDIIVAAAGQFDRTDFVKRLDAMFTASKAAPRKDVFPSATLKPVTKCLIVHMPITQAYVRIGLPLFKRPHEDYYAVSVLNMILGGGGFTSRLGTKVRSDAGLTYSIYSQAESNYTYPGTFYIDYYTKTETFAQATSLTLKEIEKIRAEGVTEQELANAKSSLIGELPSMFRSPGDIVSTYAWNEYYGRPHDHFAVYPEKIKALTRDDILRVAQKYLDPTRLTYTIVADTASLSKHGSGHGFSLSDIKDTRTITPDNIPKLP